MTQPRSNVYDPEDSGFYHCISRCVRQAFLCGYDKYSSKNYEHRKEWVRDRLKELLEIFAIDCLAYAVMSTHLHSLLHTKPELSKSWSDEEVARRWRLLFPRRRGKDGKAARPNPDEIKEITSQSKLVKTYQNRLSNLSWFKACLNSHIARMANFEDDCTGRFWQGRFKCQALTNKAAVLACSIYIDLNPIRANIANTPESSSYTSIQDRICDLMKLPHSEGPKLVLHENHIEDGPTTNEYIELVEETGKILLKGKGSIPKNLQPILVRLGIKPDGLIKNTKAQSRLFHCIIGSVNSIKKRAKAKGKYWYHGLRAAEAIFDS